MTLSIAVTDNQDGSGATATISGSGGESGIVQVQQWGGAAWTQAAAFSGDGDVSLSLSAGYYWAVAIAAGGTSNLERFTVTTASQSIEERCLLAVQAGIQDMAAAGSIGVQAAHVYVKMALDDKNVRMPAVILTPAEPEQVRVTGTNAKDDIAYPVVVQIVDRNSQDYTAKLSPYLLWRQNAMRYFRNQRLAGVSEVYNVEVSPEVIFDPMMPAYQYMVSAFVLRCIAREQRGI